MCKRCGVTPAVAPLGMGSLALMSSIRKKMEWLSLALETGAATAALGLWAAPLSSQHPVAPEI